MEKQKCLLVIDVQNGVFTMKRTVYQADDLVANLKRAIQWARNEGIPVIYVQHENNTFLKRDTGDWEIADAIAPREGDIHVYKKKPNAFEGTNLKEILDREGIWELIVGGLISNGCVQATCEGAVELGYRVTLLKDGHSTMYKHPETVIRDVEEALGEKGVEIRTVGEVIG